jgi:hypothetical protein
MTRKPDVVQARKWALKALIPHAHLLAASYELGPGGKGEARPEDALVGEQLRRLAHLMDGLSERGTPTVLEAFFGGA